MKYELPITTYTLGNLNLQIYKKACYSFDGQQREEKKRSWKEKVKKNGLF